MSEKAYVIKRVLHDERALASVVIPVDKSNAADGCPECPGGGTAPHDFFIKGFDDFSDFDPTVKAFLSVGPPLVAAPDWITVLATRLTGVTAVRVGFAEWDERPLPPEVWFDKYPKLGGLFVSAQCDLVRGPASGLAICPECGRQRIKWYAFMSHPDAFAIDSDALPDADVFLLPGASQELGVCLTAHGRDVIESLGFGNLEFIELRVT